jgi:hypothetical protein
MGTIAHKIRGMLVDGDGRSVVDCVGLNSWLFYDRASGAQTEQLVDKPGQLITLTFHRIGASWKATNLYLEGQCK